MVARLHLGEEPDVLDGDDGLVREGLEQFDLPIRERPGPSARDGDDTDRDAVAQHRDADGASEGGDLRRRTEVVTRLRLDVRDVRDLAVEDRSSRGAAPVRRSWECPSEGLVALRCQPVMRDEIELLAVEPGRRSRIRLRRAAPRCARSCRRPAGCRSASSLITPQDLARRRLLLQRLGELRIGGRELGSAPPLFSRGSRRIPRAARPSGSARCRAPRARRQS